MKHFYSLWVCLMCSVMTMQAAKVTFSTTNQLDSWLDMSAKANGTVITSGADVADGTQVTFQAWEGVGYHVDWYVNDVKTDAKGFSLTITVNGDTKVEARYVEHYKFIFEGTPYVKYANEKGVVWLTQNFFNHDYYVQDNFAHSVSQWTGSNGKTYKVDNLPLDTTVITRDTLTADVTLKPTYIFNEEDLGDATVTVTWGFAQPDTLCPLFRNFGGENAICGYVKPTLFNSYYVDVNMKIDATKGHVDNDKVGATCAKVAKGTRFTVPSRYGTSYTIVAENEITDLTIAGETDWVKGTQGTNHTATLDYYNSTTDSIDIVLGNDLQLVSIAASFPGGDNVLAWVPNYNVAESTLGTRSKTGMSGALLHNMTDITNDGGLVITPNQRDSLSSLIEMTKEKVESKCLTVAFDIKKGFSFKPMYVSVPIMPVNAGTNTKVELILSDEKGSVIDTLFTGQKTDSLKCDTLLSSSASKQNQLYMYGKVTLKIYVYGAEANFRLGFPITISGELCETIAFPEGEDFMPYLTKSAIDVDGLGLINVKAYEVVGVRGREGERGEETLVIIVPIEEIPMGDPLLVKTTEPGAIYNIPLTRNDDPHIGTNNLLRVSNGFVVDGIDSETIFRFEKRDGYHCFRRAVVGETIPEEEIYLRWWNSHADVDVYYFDVKDIPTLIPMIVADLQTDKPKKICVNGKIFIVKPDGSVYAIDGSRIR